MFDFDKIIKNHGYNLDELTGRELEEVYVKVKLNKKFEKDLKKRDFLSPIKQEVWLEFMKDLNKYGRSGIETWFYENGDKDLIKEIEKYKKGNNDFIDRFFLYLTDDNMDREKKHKTIKEWLKESLKSKDKPVIMILKEIENRKSNNKNKRMTF